jgi:hypothetical protein
MNKQDKEKALEIALSFIDSSKPTLDRCVETGIQMAAWKERQMIEKAVKFIDENTFGMLDDGVPYIQSIHDTSKNEFIKDLKKYMEEN